MDELIATFPKNATDEIRVTIGKSRDFELVSVRVYWEPEPGREKVPTRKGISVRTELLPELIHALNLALIRSNEEGLHDLSLSECDRQ